MAEKTQSAEFFSNILHSRVGRAKREQDREDEKDEKDEETSDDTDDTEDTENEDSEDQSDEDSDEEDTESDEESTDEESTDDEESDEESDEEDDSDEESTDAGELATWKAHVKSIQDTLIKQNQELEDTEQADEDAAPDKTKSKEGKITLTLDEKEDIHEFVNEKVFGAIQDGDYKEFNKALSVVMYAAVKAAKEEALKGLVSQMDMKIVKLIKHQDNVRSTWASFFEANPELRPITNVIKQRAKVIEQSLRKANKSYTIEAILNTVRDEYKPLFVAPNADKKGKNKKDKVSDKKSGVGFQHKKDKGGDKTPTQADVFKRILDSRHKNRKHKDKK